MRAQNFEMKSGLSIHEMELEFNGSEKWLSESLIRIWILNDRN